MNRDDIAAVDLALYLEACSLKEALYNWVERSLGHAYNMLYAGAPPQRLMRRCAATPVSGR
jgi:hypothetical protein